MLQKSALLVNQIFDDAANFLFASQVLEVAGNEVFRTDDRLANSLAVLLAAGLVIVRYFRIRPIFRSFSKTFAMAPPKTSFDRVLKVRQAPRADLLEVTA